ncbi:glycoside hydrolase family 15 protein [Plantactinospora sp. WMMB334]|uniref:glycoside hydrolase family 15 protein n=1 Tax=Plantactinospora sp. WMMB334 TaxID=3404119 RepID=UPI003B933E5E
MSLPLEDYAFVGNTRTGALIGRDGSVDWLCLPRFDSDACFAALLGEPAHGRWSLSPAGRTGATRRYLGDSLVLATDFTTEGGAVRVTDCMPVEGAHDSLIRRVEGVRGSVEVETEIRLRFDYGLTEPWLRRDGDRVTAIAGPHTVAVDSPVPLQFRDGTLSGHFRLHAGDSVDLCLTYLRHGESAGPVPPAAAAIAGARNWWQGWADRCTVGGRYRDPLIRSLLTLKALTYAPTGGILAAPTTSLPERLGGVRNWDYRYCWIRDATFTLLAFLDAGYTREAVAWREWLLRAVAGRPDQMQIMYGLHGERRLTEMELDWLPGYAGSTPVRIGNAAAGQFQLDVYGELMDALHQARSSGIEPDPDAWRVQRDLLDFLESRWSDPDEGIWEIRGPRRHFTHSKVMAWVAADRAVKDVERFDLDGPVPRWRRLRAEIFDEVCAKGYDAGRNTFTRSYGSPEVDAALLLMAPVGFLPATDPRIVGTVAAIERDLCRDGFVQRYRHEPHPGAGHGRDTGADGLPPGEGAFLAASFWLADNYLLRGDLGRARATFERLLEVGNDVGLLAEEYDVDAARLVGNFPQALSHLQLVNTALNLTQAAGPARHRAEEARR